ncbi:SNF2-related protein [Aquimarina sp. MMG016]|uniref:DEAD/DEAH box helicase n=1 Tax=Aquimarina sp. MMG016 TaxID=2822690 RepID=UPI001B39D9A4|nr:SNF2-related protein [Aquimarina sp. MMG016]MBQ4818511.1 DEAD/DEAH box helicase family protein [Aquimarina sp. MMG016]
MDHSCICYNIVEHTFSEIPRLPEAFIVSYRNNQLEYIEKQATAETLESFKLPYQETPHEQLLEICSVLRPTALEQRFQPKKKRKNLSLQELLKDPKIKEIILSFVTRKLTTFYNLVHQHQYPISYQAKRKEPVENFRLQINKIPLEPILQFTKTEEGIEYAFTLQHQEKEYIPSKNDIKILLNEPSWIILNQNLFQIQGLNANKLKPFLNKEKITIQQKHIKTYLEKVIVPVIKNIEVEANGFEIINNQNLISYSIEIVQDFIQNKYVAKIVFIYEHCSFDFNSHKTTTSDVFFENEDQIQIIQTKRNSELEQEIVNRLVTKGLTLNHNLLLEIPETDDTFAIIDWVKTHNSKLKAEGFKIKLPEILDKQISVEPHHIEIQNDQQKDWFDIKGVVTIGSQEIAFSKFIKHIRQNDRFFPLDDNSLFIIPQEWMTRYKKLADFGKVEEENIILNKSNYTVLKDIIPPEEISIEEIQETSYHASSDLKATLRPYQLEGVQWLVKHYHNGLGACLADDMGLGKTLQTIATLVFAKEQLQPTEENVEKIQFDLFSNPLEVKTFLKALIVLPSSLVFNWAQEILKFAPHFNIVKYTGADRKKITPYIETYDIILTTYTTIARDIEALKKFSFNYLIIDESQQIKNKDSKIFQAINQINTQNKISLSGTPIENSLSDLWSQMQFINPGMLGSFAFFKDHFKIPIEKHQDIEKVEELKTLIEPFILRRVKEQVAKDLPELSEQIIYTEMLPKQEKLYESEKSAARNLLLGIDGQITNKINIINTLTKLRQLANHPVLLDAKIHDPSGKFEDVTNYLETLVKANKKVLIFSSFVSHLSLYENWCRQNSISYVTLTGKTATSEREEIVNHFQEDDHINLFFISLKAGGVGLNLTKASYVILLDPWWNPFIEKQAIARSHRIGQTNNVMVTRFITKNSIEEKIIQLQEKKKHLSDEIIEVNAIPEYIEEGLEELLK